MSKSSIPQMLLKGRHREHVLLSELGCYEGFSANEWMQLLHFQITSRLACKKRPKYSMVSSSHYCGLNGSRLTTTRGVDKIPGHKQNHSSNDMQQYTLRTELSKWNKDSSSTHTSQVLQQFIPHRSHYQWHLAVVAVHRSQACHLLVRHPIAPQVLPVNQQNLGLENIDHRYY